MNYKGLHINLAELAMVLTALGALITAWRGGKAVQAAKKDAEAEKGKQNGSESGTGN